MDTITDQTDTVKDRRVTGGTTPRHILAMSVLDTSGDRSGTVSDMDTSRDAHRGGLNSAVAAVIQGERKMAGLTIDQLADKAGIGRQTLLRRLTGKTRNSINVNEVAQLADVFRLTPSEMIEKAEEWQRRNIGHDPAEVQETAERIVRDARSTVREVPPHKTADAANIRDVKRRRSSGPA